MLGVLLTLVLGFFACDVVGYGVHWLMHRRWTGPLWRAHQTHHRLYTPRDFASDTYRHAGRDSTASRFTVVVLGLIGILFLAMPWHLALVLSVEVTAYALVNDYLHDATHVDGHWLGRYVWYWRLRRAHLVHHANQKRNLGVATFMTDRVLGTYATTRSPKV